MRRSDISEVEAAQVKYVEIRGICNELRYWSQVVLIGHEVSPHGCDGRRGWN
jgi:hypothetical protein